MSQIQFQVLTLFSGPGSGFNPSISGVNNPNSGNPDDHEQNEGNNEEHNEEHNEGPDDANETEESEDLKNNHS